ncbi:MAG TPA: hypothetical protein VGR10_01345 [Thermoleophilaceae bacterium]|nr:hypothetical protein [Thermoleophilaceae bacterium]
MGGASEASGPPGDQGPPDDPLSGHSSPGDAGPRDDLEQAVEALNQPGRLREAESRVARIAPQLQRVLAGALSEGGYFDEAHRSEVLKAATKPDPDERIAAVRALLAEETRIGMMVGVAVGWELARELDLEHPPDGDHDDSTSRGG